MATNGIETTEYDSLHRVLDARHSLCRSLPQEGRRRIINPTFAAALCPPMCSPNREASSKQSCKNFDLFGTPHAAIIPTEPSLRVYGAVGCGAYLSTFLLAAESLGVATIPQAAPAMHPDFLRHISDSTSRGWWCAA